MTAADVLWSLVVGFLTVKLVGLAINLPLFPRLSLAGEGGQLASGRTERRDEGAADERLGSVSILLPVRDEAHNLARTLPKTLAQRVGEIVVLNDGSVDDTAEVVRCEAAGDGRVRLLEGEPLPDGWIGKNWACHQLARAATGDRLVFLDADVHLAPGAIAALVTEMDRQRADAFSVFPRQLTGTLGERALLPLVDDVLLSFLPFPLLSTPRAVAAAAANGQAFAFRRASYEAFGGHAAVAGEILEDVLLARHVRRSGHVLGLALGGDAIAVRMYRSYPEMVRGLAKSLLAAHGDVRALLVVAAAWHVVVYTLPAVLVAFDVRWAVPFSAALLERVLVNAKTGRGAPWEALLMPLAPLLALPVHVRALSPRRVWKGRSYG